MSTNRNVAVKLSNIQFGYNRKNNIKVINDLSFEIYDGEYVCIVGSNGCGKSTISKIIFGLLKP